MGRVCNAELYFVEKNASHWVFTSLQDDDTSHIRELIEGDFFILIESVETQSGIAMLKVITRSGVGLIYPSVHFAKQL